MTEEMWALLKATEHMTDPNVERIRQVRREMFAGCDTSEKFIKRMRELEREYDADPRNGVATRKSKAAKSKNTRAKIVAKTPKESAK